MRSRWFVANSMPVKTEYPFGLMGILNLTPDSFYDGGKYCNLNHALAQCKRLLSDGADIIDIGAESSRPGAVAVGLHEEQRRLYPVLEACRKTFPNAIFSVDCWRALTAAGSLARGADIINDISGCNWDPELIEVLKEFKPGYILMHSNPTYETRHKKIAFRNIINDIKKFFAKKLNHLVKNGLPEDHITLDPGIGFGKTKEQNLVVLQNLNQFLEFNRPLLIGLSMKSLFQQTANIPIEKRIVPTAVASVFAWQKGAFWHRAHHPESVRLALQTACSFSSHENLL